MIVGLLGIFGSKLLSLFLMSAFHSFSVKCLCYRQIQAMVVTLKIHNSGLDRLDMAIFWHFATVISVSTHTLGATGLDQLAGRCVKLRRRVLLTSLQNRGENRLWLRFRKYTIFTFCVEGGWNIPKFVTFAFQKRLMKYNPNIFQTRGGVLAFALSAAFVNQ